MKLPPSLPLVLKLIVLSFALGSVCIVTYAKYRLTSVRDQVIVVSSRPKADDTYYILRSKAGDRVLYLRSDEPFSKALAKSFPSGVAQEDRSFYRSIDHNVAGRLSPDEATRELETVAWLERTSGEFPNVALSICLGLGVGLLLPLGTSSIVPVLLFCCMVAVLKVLSACPTCPRPEVLGIDAAILGAVGFGALGALFLAPSRRPSFDPARKRILLASVAGVLVWQSIVWWSYKLQCLPCSVLGFVLAWQLASSSRWMEEEGRAFSLKFAVAATGVLAFVGFLVSPHIASGAPQQSVHLAALGQPKPLQIEDVREAGLLPTGHPQVLFVAAKGCHACESGLAAIDSIPLTGLTYLYVGLEPPDSTRRWTHFLNSSSIRTTPTTLFVDGRGKVVRQTVGYNSEPRVLAAYLRQISMFLSGKPIS